MKNLKNPYSKLDVLKETNPTGLSSTDDLEIFEYLKENPDHRVLNCGSGNTNLIDNRVVHLDIYKYKIIGLIADASCLPFKKNSFDAIFCQAMLEHVKNPFQVVQAFTTVLKEGGYVRARLFLFFFHFMMSLTIISIRQLVVFSRCFLTSNLYRQEFSLVLGML